MSSKSPGGHKGHAYNVLMLDDTQATFQLDAKTTGRDLIELVYKYLKLVESDYFSVEVVTAKGKKSWLDYDKPVSKQVGSGGKLIFGVKFYTPDPGQLEEEYTRYLFALQIKRDLAEGSLLCSDATASLLVSYILQAEMGDYVEAYGNSPAYFNDKRYFPHQNEAHEVKIMDYHKNHVGQSPADADVNLLDIARKVELYGIVMHAAKDHEGVQLNLAVTHLGILVFQHYTKINTFSWAKIRKLSFKRKKFLIKLHPEGYANFYKDTVEFYFAERDDSKSFWKKCIENHSFFRCVSTKRMPRQKSKLLTRGSSFRYYGRTQKELIENARENFSKNRSFERSYSMRSISHIGNRQLLSDDESGGGSNPGLPQMNGTQSLNRNLASRATGANIVPLVAANGLHGSNDSNFVGSSGPQFNGFKGGVAPGGLLINASPVKSAAVDGAGNRILAVNQHTGSLSSLNNFTPQQHVNFAQTQYNRPQKQQQRKQHHDTSTHGSRTIDSRYSHDKTLSDDDDDDDDEYEEEEEEDDDEDIDDEEVNNEVLDEDEVDEVDQGSYEEKSRRPTRRDFYQNGTQQNGHYGVVDERCTCGESHRDEQVNGNVSSFKRAPAATRHQQPPQQPPQKSHHHRVKSPRNVNGGGVVVQVPIIKSSEPLHHHHGHSGLLTTVNNGTMSSGTGTNPNKIYSRKEVITTYKEETKNTSQCTEEIEETTMFYDTPANSTASRTPLAILKAPAAATATASSSSFKCSSSPSQTKQQPPPLKSLSRTPPPPAGHVTTVIKNQTTHRSVIDSSNTTTESNTSMMPGTGGAAAAGRNSLVQSQHQQYDDEPPTIAMNDDDEGKQQQKPLRSVVCSSTSSSSRKKQQAIQVPLTHRVQGQKSGVHKEHKKSKQRPVKANNANSAILLSPRHSLLYSSSSDDDFLPNILNPLVQIERETGVETVYYAPAPNGPFFCRTAGVDGRARLSTDLNMSSCSSFYDNEQQTGTVKSTRSFTKPTKSKQRTNGPVTKSNRSTPRNSDYLRLSESTLDEDDNGNNSAAWCMRRMPKVKNKSGDKLVGVLGIMGVAPTATLTPASEHDFSFSLSSSMSTSSLSFLKELTASDSSSSTSSSSALSFLDDAAQTPDSPLTAAAVDVVKLNPAYLALSKRLVAHLIQAPPSTKPTDKSKKHHHHHKRSTASSKRPAESEPQAQQEVLLFRTSTKQTQSKGQQERERAEVSPRDSTLTRKEREEVVAQQQQPMTISSYQFNKRENKVNKKVFQTNNKSPNKSPAKTETSNKINKPFTPPGYENEMQRLVQANAQPFPFVDDVVEEHHFIIDPPPAPPTTQPPKQQQVKVKFATDVPREYKSLPRLSNKCVELVDIRRLPNVTARSYRDDTIDLGGSGDLTSVSTSSLIKTTRVTTTTTTTVKQQEQRTASLPRHATLGSMALGAAGEREMNRVVDKLDLCTNRSSQPTTLFKKPTGADYLLLSSSSSSTGSLSALCSPVANGCLHLGDVATSDNDRYENEIDDCLMELELPVNAFGTGSFAQLSGSSAACTPAADTPIVVAPTSTIVCDPVYEPAHNPANEIPKKEKSMPLLGKVVVPPDLLVDAALIVQNVLRAAQRFDEKTPVSEDPPNLSRGATHHLSAHHLDSLHASEWANEVSRVAPTICEDIDHLVSAHSVAHSLVAQTPQAPIDEDVLTHAIATENEQTPPLNDEHVNDSAENNEKQLEDLNEVAELADVSDSVVGDQHDQQVQLEQDQPVVETELVEDLDKNERYESPEKILSTETQVAQNRTEPDLKQVSDEAADESISGDGDHGATSTELIQAIQTVDNNESMPQQQEQMEKTQSLDAADTRCTSPTASLQSVASSAMTSASDVTVIDATARSFQAEVETSNEQKNADEATADTGAIVVLADDGNYDAFENTEEIFDI